MVKRAAMTTVTDQPALPTPTVGIVLAGGQSRRFGRDKVVLRLADGPTLLETAVSALQTAGVETVAIAVSSQQRAARLQCTVPGIAGVPFIVDSTPNCGPLGALHTALCRYPYSRILLVASDMPYLHWAALRLLIHDGTDTESVDVVMPCIDGRDQPLHARYGPACRDVAARLLAQGRRAMRDLIASPELRVRRIDNAAWSARGIDAAVFTNINTSDDIAALTHAHV